MHSIILIMQLKSIYFLWNDFFIIFFLNMTVKIKISNILLLLNM